MGLRDMIIGRFVKVDEDYDDHDPGPDGREVLRRQRELEAKLEERRRRRDLVRAQVEGLRGTR